jgi:5-methylcytosine-specific restriction protein B
VRNIPTLRLSYSNLVLKELESRGSATMEQLLDVPDVEALFKSGRTPSQPLGRMQDLLRYATFLDLTRLDGKTYSLTGAGLRYAAAVDLEDPWVVQDDHRALLQEQLAAQHGELAQDALLALDVQRELNDLEITASDEEYGRFLAQASQTEQWREARTFESQGVRYRKLLQEAGLITETYRITDSGASLLRDVKPPSHAPIGELLTGASQPRVWWVNQGSTYGKEREGGFIWAPLLNKAGRAQRHWDAMDDVRRGDVILHYSVGFLRSASVAQGGAQPEPNPLDTDAWQRDGRLIHTRYRDLNEPIALAAIPEKLRVPSSGPFTSVGSVQQGYLYAVDERFSSELADRFSELREILGHYRPPSDSVAIDPSEIFKQLASDIEGSGLTFPPENNLLRSFVSSLLAKPFSILTGLSGSGKTQLAMRLGEWFGADDSGQPRHMIVPVRPDWTGPEALFGYEDALRSAQAQQAVWHVPEPLKFILRAAEDATHPYLLILDEMNLAHVERYFADFLSGLESRKPLLPDLEEKNLGEWRARTTTTTLQPLPRNLFVVGTVNVDETTYMFSPKVLDRASTFEFRVAAESLDPDLGRPSSISAAADGLLRGFCDLAEGDDWQRHNPHPHQAAVAESLREVHRVLAHAGLEFGHRTFYESLRFAAFYAATGDQDLDHVLDLIMMQKILPKVHGSRRQIEPTLTKVLAYAAGDQPLEPRLPQTHRKVARMINAVQANQFVSFTE